MKLMCVVVVLLSCINVSYTCPSGCSCSYDGSVDCKNMGFEVIPSGIPNTTKILYLDNNQITDISPQAFAGLSGLTVLHLENNQITDISPQAFAGLSALTELSLGVNPWNCSSCNLEALKVFLNNQTHLGDVSAICDGTSTYVVNYDFQNCTERTPRKTRTSRDDNSINNTSSYEDSLITTEVDVPVVVVSVVAALAVAVAVALSIVLAYTCSVKNRISTIQSTV